MTEYEDPGSGDVVQRRREEAGVNDSQARQDRAHEELSRKRIDALVYSEESQSAALARRARQLREALEAFGRAVQEYHAAQAVVLPNRHMPFDGLDEHGIEWEKRYLRVVEESDGDPIAIAAWLDAELGPSV